MAQIKDFTIKNVTRFKGHEGEPCVQGSIYYNGKKVGYYSDSFTMGEPTIDFDDKEIWKIAYNACNDYYMEHPMEEQFQSLEPSLDLFFNEIIQLMDYEKQYKKCIKQGFPVFVTYEKQNGIEQMVGFKIKDAADKTYYRAKEHKEH